MVLSLAWMIMFARVPAPAMGCGLRKTCFAMPEPRARRTSWFILCIIRGLCSCCVLSCVAADGVSVAGRDWALRGPLLRKASRDF